MLETKKNSKVGQLLIIGFDGKIVPNNMKKLIHDYQVGGIILFSRNIGTPNEILDLTTSLQREAKIAGYKYPLFICIDQENGVVRRLGNGTSTFPGAMALGATDEPENAYKVGLATGKELKALGINWNIAPVLDVNNNPDNPVIGVRSYGESPEKVAKFGRAAMKGMQAAGIVTTLKHFPGHGDSSVDSHLSLPVIAHSMKRLEEVELLPFKECIEDGADTVMAAHVYFPAIEAEQGVPATLSKKVINGLLRGKLEFNGVVITDCMEMKAISETIGTEKGGVEALKAGVDIVMVSHSYDMQIRTIQEIQRALDSGEIDNEIVDQAIQRIESLKEKYLSWDDITLDTKGDVTGIVGSAKDKEWIFEIYKQGVTIVKDNGILPLAIDNQSRILVINPINNQVYGAEDQGDSKTSLGEAVQEYNPNVDVYQISNTVNEEEIENIIKKASQYDNVIIGTLSVTAGSYQVDLVKGMLKNGTFVIVVAMRNPYDLRHFPNVPVYLTTYEFTFIALKAAAGAIFGKDIVSGQLPVTITQMITII